MPTIRLAVSFVGPMMPVTLPVGGRLDVPRARFHCLVQVPQALMPFDAVIDTGAPLSCFPNAVWRQFVEGVDYEWLPFAGGTPPSGRVVGWLFNFRMARFLRPLAMMDYTTALDRPNVIAQFADSDPPRRANAPPVLIIGLWGGILEGGRIVIDRDPRSGHVTGSLEFP